MLDGASVHYGNALELREMLDYDFTDLSKGIRETTEFVELFLRNFLLGETNELKNRHLHIRWKEQKQDIGDTKSTFKNYLKSLDMISFSDE